MRFDPRAFAVPDLEPWHPRGRDAREDLDLIHDIVHRCFRYGTRGPDLVTNPMLPAGYTYFTQFIQNEMTARGSRCAPATADAATAR